MSKKKSITQKVQSTNSNHIVDTESEFAAEYGEWLYGGQAREAYEQEKVEKNNKKSSQ